MAKAAAKRRSHSSKSGVSIKTNAPHQTTLIVSVVVFALGILGALVAIPVVTALSFWLALVGYLILLIGCVAKGF
jgi:hypothetical protein